MREHASSDDLARALVRFNAHAMGLTTGLIAAAGVAVATLALIVQGGENVGTMLSTLGLFFPGYRVSVGGALVGAAWAGLVSYGLTVLFAQVFGSWTLRRLRAQMDAGAPPDLVGGVAALSPLVLGVTTGAVLALALFVAHHWIHWRADTPDGPALYLALLANYLPGYSAAFAGGFIGASWMFVYGFSGAAAVAWIYNAVVELRARIRSLEPAPTDR